MKQHHNSRQWLHWSHLYFFLLVQVPWVANGSYAFMLVWRLQMRWEVRMGCYGGVLACNVAMWTLYVQSLTLLSSLQATCFNFAANFLLSGLAGFLLFGEAAHFQVSSCLNGFLSCVHVALLWHPVPQAILTVGSAHELSHPISNCKS